MKSNGKRLKRDFTTKQLSSSAIDHDGGKLRDSTFEGDAVLRPTQQLRQRGLAVFDGFSARVSPIEFQQVERAQGDRLIASPVS
jgi:hypothetical protein